MSTTGAVIFTRHQLLNRIAESALVDAVHERRMARHNGHFDPIIRKMKARSDPHFEKFQKATDNNFDELLNAWYESDRPHKQVVEMERTRRPVNVVDAIRALLKEEMAEHYVVPIEFLQLYDTELALAKSRTTTAGASQ